MPEFSPDDDEPTTDRMYRLVPVRRPDLPDLDAIDRFAEGAEGGAIVDIGEIGDLGDLGESTDEILAIPGAGEAARFEPGAPEFPVGEREPERDRRRWLAASLAGLVVAAGFATLGLVQDAPIAPGATADAGVAEPSTTTPAPASVPIIAPAATTSPTAPAAPAAPASAPLPVADAGPDADRADDDAADITADESPKRSAAKPAVPQRNTPWRNMRGGVVSDKRPVVPPWTDSDAGSGESSADEGHGRDDADKE